MFRQSETDYQQQSGTNRSTPTSSGTERQMALGATEALQSNARLRTPKVRKSSKLKLTPRYLKQGKFWGDTPYRGGPHAFSFKIIQNNLGMWKVRRKGGGRLPSTLTGDYTTFNRCEQRLVSYLKQYSRAVYPGSDGTS